MTLLREVVAAMERLKRSPGSIAAREVRLWLSSTDIEVLGAAYSLIMDAKFSRRIDPPLTLYEYNEFLLRYYRRCFLEDPQSEWASSRYSAGWDLANWMQGLWRQGHKEVVGEVKSWLAEVYREADPALRECIINATLEHALRSRPIAKFFLDWSRDPLLGPVYRAALDPTSALPD